MIEAPIPQGEVLSLVVETAIAVLHCKAGALFLLDEQGHELVFQVAIGGRAERVTKYRVALGHGIAGYVAATLELLNKVGGPFTTRDMEILGRFGRLAAFAIDQARLHKDLAYLFRSLLRDALGNGSPSAPAERFADLAAADMEHADAVRLAGMVHELNRRGEDARRLAGDVLSAVTR